MRALAGRIAGTAAACLLLSPTAFAQAQHLPDTAGMKRAPVQGGDVEYEVRGEGEPVLLIHGAFVAASFFPGIDEPPLADYRLIRYHRRGFAGSTAPIAPLERQVDDAVALLRHVGVERAHIVGHSGGGRIALQLALDASDVVHSLVLLEPPGVGPVPSERKWIEEVIEPATERYRAGDTVGAVDIFMQDTVAAPEWRTEIARTVTGGPEQAERDAAAFFEDRTPAERWVFDEEKAEAIPRRIPILYVWGSETLPFLKEGRELIHTWFPRAEDYRVEGVGHSLPMEAPREVATAIADFLRRHPIDGGSRVPTSSPPP